MFSYGLIAGLTYTEMAHMQPGFILDLYKYRTQYDAALSGAGIARKLMGGTPNG